MPTLSEAIVEQATSAGRWGTGRTSHLTRPPRSGIFVGRRRRSRPINGWRGRHTTPRRGDLRGRFTGAIHEGDSRIAPTTTV